MKLLHDQSPEPPAEPGAPEAAPEAPAEEAKTEDNAVVAEEPAQ